MRHDERCVCSLQPHLPAGHNWRPHLTRGPGQWLRSYNSRVQPSPVQWQSSARVTFQLQDTACGSSDLGAQLEALCDHEALPEVLPEQNPKIKPPGEHSLRLYPTRSSWEPQLTTGTNCRLRTEALLKQGTWLVTPPRGDCRAQLVVRLKCNNY